MSNRNNQNQSKIEQSSIFYEANSDYEYASEVENSSIAEEDEDLMLDEEEDYDSYDEEIEEEEEEEEEEQEDKIDSKVQQRKLKKRITEDFSGAQHLKGINFKKGMNQQEFSILKKNIKRTKLQDNKKKLVGKLSKALQNVVQIDDFENFKTPQSQKTKFIEPKKKVLEQIQLKGDFLGKLNKFVRDIALEAQDNIEFTSIMSSLRIMIEGMLDVNFNWELYEEKIPEINKLFEFLLSLVQENFHYNFIDLNPIIQKLPISSMLKFLQYPLYDTNNWQLQEKVNRFFVNILSIFRNLYIKFCLMERQVINVKQIFVIDPFLRISIRKNNLQYFSNNFWSIQGFELYEFVYELMDKLVLTILPKFKYEQKQPLIVHILGLVLDLYRFGLVTFVQNKKMLEYIHLISEVMISYEQKIIDKQIKLKEKNIENERDGLKKMFLKLPKGIKENFLECKEKICSILIHSAAIFCDVTFEEALHESQIQNYDFRNYLMNDQTSFIYFSSIAIKYLSQYLVIQEKEITSVWLQEGLAIIYNFIGDDQNDFFIQSLYLLKQGIFKHYYDIQLKQRKGNDIDASTVVRYTNNFVDKLKDVNRKNFQTELQLYFQSIMPMFEKNSKNLDFNLVLSRNNFPYFILMSLYYLDSIEQNSELFFHGFYMLQNMLKNNYTGQGIIFRGDSITFFRQLMLNRNFECMVMIKEVFSNDPFVLFISPSIFKFNINIYQQFLQKLTTQIKNQNFSNSTRSLIGVLFFFTFYFMNVLEDHEVKSKQRRKFHLIVAEEISDFFQQFVYPKFFESNSKFTLDETLNDILSFNLSDFQKYKQLIKGIDCKSFLEQFYYVIFKLFNKATFKEYSGNVCNKVFNKIYYLEVTPQDDNFTKYSILERLEKLKLRNRFQIFFVNNLLTQREIFNPKYSLVCGEQCIPERHYSHIFNIIFNEFDFLFKYKKKYPEITNKDNEIFNQYVFKGLLDTVFRYLKGIRLNFYNFIDIPDPTQLNSFQTYITEQLKNLDENDQKKKEMKEQFKFIFSKIYDTDDYYKDHQYVNKTGIYEKQLCLCYYFIFNLQKLKNILYDNLKLFNIQRRESNKLDLIDDQILLKQRKPDIIIKIDDINLIIFKNHIKDLIEEILKIIEHKYSQTVYYYIIARYKGNNEGKTLIQKKFLFARSIKGEIKKSLKKTIKQKQSYYHQVLIPFKTIYKKHKKTMNDQGENNQFLKVLVNKKDLSKNLKNLIFYFIQRINEVEVLMKEKDYDKQFLNNDYYTYLIIILDNLMLWKKQIKEFFLKLIQEQGEQGERARNVIKILSKCQFILYKIVIFKTFQDKLWKSYWSKYYIISKFLQNLCSNNNTKFKKILSDYSCAPGVLQNYGNRAINYTGNTRYFYFFELYILCEISASENPAWFNRNPQILLEDKPFSFVIMQRLIEQITEHVQGPYLDNQLLVYRYRPDIWTGIMTRIIDDIDDDFYKLSTSVILYFDALIEGLNDTIVSFLSSNINIDQLFNVIVRLIHKLYIRQARYIEYQNSSNDSQIDYSSISVVTQQDENEIQIKSYQDLLSMYTKYENFVSHQVLKYAIDLYIFLYNISIKIKFFGFFLKDKIQNVKQYEEDQEYRLSRTVQQTNEIHALNFLYTIISSIEIVIQQNENYYLQEIFFQRPPESFFMGFIAKNHFVNNVNIEDVKSVHLDLFSSVPSLHYEMIKKRKDYIRLNYMYYFTTPEFFRRVHQFLYLLSFILNILMTNSIIFTHFDDESVDVTGALVNTKTNEVFIRSIGLIIAIMSVFFSILWIIFRYKKIRKKKFIEKTNYGMKLNFIDRIRISIFTSLLNNGRFISFFLHAIFSFLGVFVNYFYFTLNLFLISNLSKTISYVMRALVEHKQKFIIVLMLTLMVVFSYSFLLIRYFKDQVNTEQFGDDVCNDFFSCYFNSVNLGIKAGGGISDPLVLVANPNQGIFWGRFFFDISFFFIVKMFLLSVIAGIIIDAFNELRDELTERSHFNNNICFICGLSKWEIEKKGTLHSNHIKNSHNIWNYLFFMTKLQSNDFDNFNSLEYSLYNKYQENDTSWIPQNIFLEQNKNYMKIEKENEEEKDEYD